MEYLNTMTSSRAFKDAAYKHLALVGKALSSPVRLEILELLGQAPRPVEVIAGEINQSVANTSQHLQVLKRAQIVTAEREGLRVVHSLAGMDVAALVVDLQAVGARHVAGLERLTREFFADRDGLDAIDRDTLQARMQSGDVVLLDVRPEHEFDQAHLPGALSVPLATLEARLGDLPSGRTIVAYCRGPYCTLSADAVRLLRQSGFDAVRTEVSVHNSPVAGLRSQVSMESK